MNKLLFLIFFLLVGNEQVVNAQSYFPAGAKWHFDVPPFFTSGHSYTTLQSQGDSLFNNEMLTYISGGINCTVGENAFVKQVGDKVYKLNECDSTFSLLYDFGASVGDTVVIFPDICQFTDSILLRVESIGTLTVNGFNLNQFFVTQLNDASGLFFGGSYIERIGNPYTFYPYLGFCDPIGGPLRCFTDSVIGEYNTGLHDGVCDTIISSLEELQLENVYVYPSPTENVINVKFNDNSINGQITISNQLGQIILQEEFNNQGIITVNVNTINGVYFLRIDSNKGVLRKKFLVNR